MTTEQHQGPIRYKDTGGAWRDVDLLLAARGDGTAGAKGHALGLSIAGSSKGATGSPKAASGTDLAAVTGGPGASGAARQVVLSWPGALPAPALKGESATYTNAMPGVDVVVESRRSGFEQLTVVKDRASLDALTKGSPDGSLTIDLPVRTKGLTAKLQDDGSVAFLDAKGVEASRFTAPRAWDAVVDPRSGDRVNTTPVTVGLTQKGKGQAVLNLTVKGTWLADPARVFPITVDPTYASASVTTSFDTYVQSRTTYDTSAESELRVGTYDGGTTAARSFLNFPLSAIVGKHIESASLSIYEKWSYSCTAKSVYAYASGAASTSTRWSSQPAAYGSGTSVSAAKGFSSSCAAGRISVPMTSIVQGWAATTWSNGTVRLSASETDSYGWKKFNSLETTTDPVLTYTYDRKPNAASTPGVVGSNTYTIPGTTSSYVFTDQPRPTFTSTATDPDANSVSVTFEVHTDTSGSTKVASCATAFTASGKPATCALTTDLAQSSSSVPQYYVRAAVKDDQGLWNGTWSPWQKFYVETTPPPAARVACDNGYTDGTWTDSSPASPVTCSITAAGVNGTYQAPGYLNITVDGVAQTQLTITATNDWNVVHKQYTFQPASRGYHQIIVTAVSRSMVPQQPSTTYGFGWGDASLTLPKPGTTSSGKISVEAGGPPRASATSVTAKVQWRVAASGNETTGWTDSSNAPVTLTLPDPTTPASYKTLFDLSTATREAGAAADVPSRIPVRLDVQVCFVYSGTSKTQCSWSAAPVTVTRVPHAFGNGYPTADAGAGQVALFTGELATDATDISVPGYTGDITISRSHTSFAGDGTVANWPSDPITGVFGPGWTANLEGGDAGLAGLQVVDNTGIDGSIMFLDGEANPLVFANPANSRTYPTASYTVYLPATQDTLDAAVRLTVTGTGTSTRLTLTEDDGTATTWAPLAAPSTSGTTWRPETISEPGQNGKTTFGHDASGRVSRIVAPVPDGMTGTACPTSGTLATGCRALDITYAEASSTSFPGDIAGQVKSVSTVLWNPATSAMTSTVVATYAYDSTKRLVQVRDPRTGLGTNYSWDSTSTRIASVTPSGLAATKLTYTSGKLTQVTKANPVAGQPDVVVARYVYGVPLSGGGLPDLSATAVDAWQQNSDPAQGYAVFGQDYTGPVSGSGVDYTYADLSYVDDLGYTVNTASYGAGAWLVTATAYDTNGNVVRTLDASATAAVRSASQALTPAQVDALSTQTFYNDEEKDTSGTVILPAGSRVTDTYGPTRAVALADGSQVTARPHTHTDYDGAGTATTSDDAPNGGVNPATGQRYSLPTTITTSAASGIGTDLENLSTTSNRYTPVVAGTGDGWTLGAPTQVTTGGITRATVYDAMGRTTQTRQPLSTGTDAGTTLTAYYTADASSADPGCRNKPEWAGLACRTWPAAAPSSGPTLPDSRTTEYTMWLLPRTVVETSGAATRTTTTGYDAAGRATSSKTAATGLTGSTGRPGTFTHYDTTTGLVDYTGVLNATGDGAETTGRTTTTFDQWGRATTVVGDAGTVTTSYDSAGRVHTVDDAKGTTTYGYDGTGERRGLVTSLTITRPGGGGALTYGASYDADGHMVRQALPGHLTQVTTYDEGGEPTGLSYLGQVTPVTETTDPVTQETTYTPGTPVQDQPWLSWSTVNDASGRVRFEATGTGSAFDPGTGVVTIDDVTPWTADANGAASSYGREYRYNGAGRLTWTHDATSGIDPATGQVTDTCTERAYTFDANGRRTNLATTSYPGGDCAATPTTTNTSSTGYDSADRPTTGRGGTGNYTYDTFGRQTSLPAVDAPNPPAGNITLGYYDDDLPRSIAQGGTTTTFTLDANGRRSVQTTTDASGATTTTRRYTDSSDNPAWVDTTTGSGTTTTRFAESVGGDLSASIDDSGDTTISLANPHGDVVTTVDIHATQASSDSATTIGGWGCYDEYGNPTDTTAVDTVDGPVGYGWLGAKQRSTTAATAGLTLMGVRLYNATRGLFTALDPVPGGNENAYAYPGDPINSVDLDGRKNINREDGGGGGGGGGGPRGAYLPVFRGKSYPNEAAAERAARAYARASTRGTRVSYPRGPSSSAENEWHVDHWKVARGAKAAKKPPDWRKTSRWPKNMTHLGTDHYRFPSRKPGLR